MTKNKIPNPNPTPRARRVVNRNQQIPNKKVKKWSSIWWKWILIGMWILILIIITIIFFFFFYLTNNPNAAKWLWMWASSIKSITSIFAGILFWSLFVLFLILGLINIYRLSTKKEWKAKYWIASFIIFILWITNISFWFIVFNKIGKIKTWDIIASTDVLIWNIHFSNKTNNKIKYVRLFENKYPLIWPTNISFLLNKDLFNRTYYPQILSKEKWWIIPVAFILNCGNGQIIKYNGYDFPQNKYCLYIKKWKYNISFKFIYNTKTKKNQEFTLPWKEINIDSAINIKSKYNIKNKNNIIIWRVWNKIKLDLSNVPIDLWLNSNKLEIEYEWEWKFKKIEWIVTFSYKTTWIHYINIKIPWDNNYPIYRIPVRVLSSNKPMCNISYKKNTNWETLFKIHSTPYGWNAIVKYNYKVKNVTNNFIVSDWRKKIIKIKLKNWSDYQVIYDIVDTKWNKWTCKSNIIKLSDKVDYSYDIMINNKVFTWNNITYEINKLPSKYNIKIWKILPNNDVEVWFDLDQDNQIDEKWKSYSFTIKDKKDKKINVIVKDIYWNTNTKKIKFKIKLKNIIAQLKNNKNKWPLPLTVNFDASTSIVNDKNDSIVFFDWDFGDRTTNNKTNQWTIKHTYTKYWTYIAKVTVETEKWYKDTAKVSIFVQKQENTATIIFPDNLWWQISAWEVLKINLISNWWVKSVKWDFGDSKIFTCTGRECMNINHTYLKKWKYQISAKISYIDGSPNKTPTTSIVVINN